MVHSRGDSKCFKGQDWDRIQNQRLNNTEYAVTKGINGKVDVEEEVEDGLGEV
jgi:hypothetical protein